MSIERTGGDLLSMKDALPCVFDDFTQRMSENPHLLGENPLKRDAMMLGMPVVQDEFGDLAVGTFNSFMDSVDKFSKKGEDLHRKMFLSQLGIGVIAIYAELAALKTIQQLPGIRPDPREIAQIAHNGYGFISGVIESGARVAPGIVREYIKPKITDEGTMRFPGTVVGGRLVRPERLQNFQIGINTDRNDAELQAIDFEQAVFLGKKPLRSSDSNPANCPAHLYLVDPATEQSYARLLFDAMIGYAQERIYPSYLPMARTALANEAQLEAA